MGDDWDEQWAHESSHRSNSKIHKQHNFVERQERRNVINKKMYDEDISTGER